MSVSDAWESPYSAAVALPQYLTRGRDQTVQLKVYRNGALVAPSSGTYTLYDAQGSQVVSAAAVSIPGSVAQYSIAAGTLPSTLPLGEDWREEWALAMPDGVTHTFRRPAALVLRALYPVISDVDLERLYSDLNELRPSGMTSYQSYIDESWLQILGRLVAAGEGRFPYMILEPFALRELHLETCLALIFRDFASSMGDGKYLALAENHKREASFAWKTLSFRYDEDHDGKPDGDKRKSSQSVVYLNSAPARRWSF